MKRAFGSALALCCALNASANNDGDKGTSAGKKSEAPEVCATVIASSTFLCFTKTRAYTVCGENYAFAHNLAVMASILDSGNRAEAAYLGAKINGCPEEATDVIGG